MNADLNKKRLESLEPRLVWEEFAAISSIPRCSKHEGAILDYIKSRASALGLPCVQDKTGNILVMKPASEKDLPGTIFQGHVDMVCEKTADSCHDFDADPLELVLDGDVLKAKDTTLGADNGIAVAIMLAMMARSFPHGALDFLFTVDEETGLTGALELDPGLLRFDTLINLDGEEESFFYIGCAGGKETEGRLTLDFSEAPAGDWGRLFELRLLGLSGGHSGAEIHLQRGNAVKLLGRVLWDLSERFDPGLVDFRGGDKHNAIPREACARFYLKKSAENPLKVRLGEWEKTLKAEFGADEPNLILSLVEADEKNADERTPAKILGAASLKKFLLLLNAFPHGVRQWSRTLPDLVSTSTNLAVVRFEEGGAFFLSSQRSDSQSLLHAVAQEVRAVLESAGAEYRYTREYPAWTPNPASPLVEKLTAAYYDFTSKKARVGSIHAGLECGVIGAKRSGMSMVSFGPDIRGAHTPGESVSVASTARTWDFLLHFLSRS